MSTVQGEEGVSFPPEDGHTLVSSGGEPRVEAP